MTTKSKGRVKWFDTGPLPAYIGFTSDERAFMREGKRLLQGGPMNNWIMAHEGAPGRTQSVWRPDGPGAVAVIVTVHREGMLKARVAEAFGLLAHETVHVLQVVEDHMGAPLGREAQAYFVQMYTQWFFKAFAEGY